MTELGLYLVKKSISKAAVSSRTGISRSRMSELTLNATTHLRAKELYLIALAIDVNPCDLLKFVCSQLRLKEE
jgi:putative transcriptional regulator